MANYLTISRYQYLPAGNNWYGGKLENLKLEYSSLTRDTSGKITINFPSFHAEPGSPEGNGGFGSYTAGYIDYLQVRVGYRIKTGGSWPSTWNASNLLYNLDADDGFHVCPGNTAYTWYSSSAKLEITPSSNQNGEIQIRLEVRGHVNSYNTNNGEGRESGYDAFTSSGSNTPQIEYVHTPYSFSTDVTTSNNIIYSANQTQDKEFYGLWNRVNIICSYHGISGLNNFTIPTQYTTKITLTSYGAVLNKIKDLLNNTDFTIPSSATEAYAAANRIKNITYSANTSIIPQLSDYCTVVNYWISNDI